MGITGREHEARRTMITLPREPFRGGQICGEQLEYGVVPGRLVFCGERKQHASFWCGEHDDQARDEYGRLPKMAPGNARGDVTVPVVLQWEPMDGSTDPVDPSPQELAAYEAQFPKFHTHYDPYGPPRRVPGTLLGCGEKQAHNIERSELWADYRYCPEFGEVSATGLSRGELTRLLIAYTRHRSADTLFRIADVVADEEYRFRVRITNRTAYSLDEPGPFWHTETWGIHADGEWHGIPKNPHPGYEHTPPWCENCGY